MWKVEKVEHAEMTVEVFENDIELYLKLFCEENKIDNMKHESQSVWNSALRYIYKHVFKGTNTLKSKSNVLINNNNIPSNCNAYDYELVLKVLDIYIYDLCMRYDKEVSIIGFVTLTGIPESIIYEWGNGERKLSSSASEIYQKLRNFREESLSNKLVTGKQNPVGVLGVLNRHYQWNMPGVTREHKKQSLSLEDIAEDIKKLNVNDTQFITQNNA